MSKNAKEQPIVFVHALGRTTLNPDVKNWTFEQLEKTFKGVLDYESLAKQLGIKPKGKNEPKPESKPETEK
jgi:hypothetical protein